MKFSSRDFILFSLLLLLEIWIALFVRDSFIRPFIGDLLVIVLIFFAIKSVFKISHNRRLAAGIFLFACLIEFCQHFKLLELLQLQDLTFLNILLGSTFDWLDILAYAAGALFILLINAKEKMVSDKQNRNQTF